MISKVKKNHEVREASLSFEINHRYTFGKLKHSSIYMIRRYATYLVVFDAG